MTGAPAAGLRRERLVVGERLRDRPAPWLVLEIHVGERVPAGIADDEALLIQFRVGNIERPRAAGSVSFQPVERIQRHARTKPLPSCSAGVAGGCSTGFGAGRANRRACSRHRRAGTHKFPSDTAIMRTDDASLRP